MFFDFIGPMIGLTIVATPIVWIVLHYRYKQGGQSGLTAEDAQQMDELMEVADSMAERIKNLESILDADLPEWRERDGEA